MESAEEMETGEGIEIEFDSRLMEEIVSHEINRRELMGDREALVNYHERVDPLYDQTPRERLWRIDEIHAELFVDFGFEGILREILNEFPVIQEKVRKMYVVPAFEEEIADLTVESEAEEPPEKLDKVLLKLSSEGFFDVEHLRMVMRHELIHVQDMLDEEFGYKPDLPSLPILERTLVADRYGVIWDIYIDNRLNREGKKTLSDKDAHHREFESLYLKIPQPERTQIFEGLWALEMITHDEILEFARDNNKLLARFTDRKEKIFLPGSPCPLCRFPTYSWMEDLEGHMDEKAIEIIQRDFPDWSPADGACERCIEVYEARVLYP